MVLFFKPGLPLAQKNVIGAALNRDSRGGRGVLDSLSMRRLKAGTNVEMNADHRRAVPPRGGGIQGPGATGFFRCASTT